MKIRADTADFGAIGQRATCASVCTRSQILPLCTGFRDFASGANKCQEGHVQNRGLKLTQCKEQRVNIKLLTPNDDYSGRTVPLTSKCFILYIYSTNIGTKYFKHGIYCPFFPLQNAFCFIILTYLVPVLFTFYKQSVLNDAFYIFIQQI